MFPALLANSGSLVRLLYCDYAVLGKHAQSHAGNYGANVGNTDRNLKEKDPPLDLQPGRHRRRLCGQEDTAGKKKKKKDGEGSRR